MNDDKLLSILLAVAAILAALVPLWYMHRTRKRWDSLRECRYGSAPENAFTVKVKSSAVMEQEKTLALPYGVTDKWFRHAYPLTQVVITVTSPSGCDARLLTNVLRDIHFSHSDPELSTVRGFGSDTDSLVSWTYEETQSELGPSFFDNHGGTLAEGWFFEREQAALPDTDILHVVLQRTQPGQMSPLTGWLERVEAALLEGKTHGGCHDDDCGWAFRLTRSKHSGVYDEEGPQ